jgi:hypothetical protein
MMAITVSNSTRVKPERRSARPPNMFAILTEGGLTNVPEPQVRLNAQSRYLPSQP